MAGSRIQLEGLMKLGATGTFSALTDYSVDLSSLVLHLNKTTVTVPATYGNPRQTERLGSIQGETIDINFASDEADATGVHSELLDAFNTASGLVYFAAKYTTGATAIGNPIWCGTFSVTGIDVGASVGEWRTQTRTYPLVSRQGPLAADPTTIT